MSKPRVLIVDDEVLNINVLIGILANDYELIIAKNGSQALRRFESQLPDLVLLDIMMPDMDGYQVFKKIQEHPEGAKVPVIFVTSRRTPEEETMGLKLGAADYITKPYTPSIVEVRVANQIRYKQNQDELERLNYTDALTGIANRRRFDESLAKWCVSDEKQSLFSLIMIDIDHFKLYNDFYGHAAGDECIKAVASQLQECVDAVGGLASRYGGEEFVVILPDTDNEQAMSCADNLCVSIQALNIPHARSETCDTVTISLGVHTVDNRDDQIRDAETIVQQADKALYRAKMAGRNCLIGSCSVYGDSSSDDTDENQETLAQTSEPAE